MNDVLVCVVRLGVALCIQECESTCLWEVRRPVSGSVACTLQRGLPALPLQISLSLQVKVWVPFPSWIPSTLQPVSLPLEVLPPSISQSLLQRRAPTQEPQPLTDVQPPSAHRQSRKSGSKPLPRSFWPELVHHGEGPEGRLLEIWPPGRRHHRI